jgi:hypothetical protein
MKAFRYFVLVAGLLLIAACMGGPPKLTTSFVVEESIRVSLPAGWTQDPRGARTQVSGGYGFASPDYAGLTYLRMHQGAMFAVMSDWDPAADARAILEVAFAKDISAPRPIDVLGTQGTYAYGQAADQGQGIGAVHVIIDGQQYAFISVVADRWKAFEATFLSIIKNLAWVEEASPLPAP